jgi:hypothetical protein
VGHRVFLLVVSFVALHDPSCGTDTPASGPNAPCQRSSDCEGKLACLHGLCASPDVKGLDAGEVDSSGADAARAD